MEEIFILEWSFSPKDYFEDDMAFSSEYGAFHVADGKVELRVSPNVYPADHSRRLEIHAELDTYFLAAQVINHKSYALDKPSVAKIRADGGRDVCIFPEAVTLTVTCGTPDIRVTDSDGNIVSDSRQERIQNRARFAELAARHADDSTVTALLASYSAAVNDPGNELVHLYEIRDALSQHFGGELAARKAIGVSSMQWSRAGQLANSEPLSQGRHRGKTLGGLRDATAAELSEAREIARVMINGYLRHIDEQDL